MCLKEPKKIGLSNLVAKILCKQHNNDLSDLDAAALNAFAAFCESIRPKSRPRRRENTATDGGYSGASPP